MPKEYIFNFPTLGETEGVKAGSLNFSTAVASALTTIEEKYPKQQDEKDEEKKRKAAEKPSSSQHDRKDSKDHAERSMYPKEYERRMKERSQHPPPQLDSQNSSQVAEQGDAKQ